MVEPPRTHSKLSCRPDSPSGKVVRGGSGWFDHTEPPRTTVELSEPPRTTLLLGESGLQESFEAVWCGRFE